MNAGSLFAVLWFAFFVAFGIVSESHLGRRVLAGHLTDLGRTLFVLASSCVAAGLLVGLYLMGGPL